MSNNVGPFTAVGDAVIFTVEYLPLAHVPEFIKGSDDGSESSPSVVADESLDVFEDEVFGLFGFEDSGDVEKERAARFIKAAAPACDRECLTRESAHEKIEVWKGIGVDECCVAVVVMVREVPFVDVDRVWFDL